MIFDNTKNGNCRSFATAGLLANNGISSSRGVPERLSARSGAAARPAPLRAADCVARRVSDLRDPLPMNGVHHWLNSRNFASRAHFTGIA